GAAVRRARPGWQRAAGSGRLRIGLIALRSRWTAAGPRSTATVVDDATSRLASFARAASARLACRLFRTHRVAGAGAVDGAAAAVRQRSAALAAVRGAARLRRAARSARPADALVWTSLGNLAAAAVVELTARDIRRCRRQRRRALHA